VLLGAILILAGCSTNPLYISLNERIAQASSDQKEIYAEQPPVTGAISLSEAAARAIKYNLDLRVKLIEESVAQGVSDTATYDMLPSMAANAGYTQRSNAGASVSKNTVTGEVSSEPSAAQGLTRQTADLSIAWSVLDFGVSYAQAKQKKMRQHVATEQRRKLLHSIVQQVRSAYWRVTSAEQLEEDLVRLSSRLRKGLIVARNIELQRLEPPMKALEYQKTLLDLMRQLNVIKREGVTAKAELSRLMNLKPGTRYEVVPPTEAEMKIPNIPTKLTELTSYAMRSRPELFSEDYNVLISAEDTQIAFLRMFPGLELRGGVNFDSNSYLQDAMWTQTGLQVTWNLLNVFSGPEKMAVAEIKEELAKLRRLALSIAVMTQVHVGHRQILQARQEIGRAHV